MRLESLKSPRESEEPKRDDKKDQKEGLSRRQFLKLAGKAALGTAAAGVLPKLEKIAEAFQPPVNFMEVQPPYFLLIIIALLKSVL